MNVVEIAECFSSRRILRRHEAGPGQGQGHGCGTDHWCGFIERTAMIPDTLNDKQALARLGGDFGGLRGRATTVSGTAVAAGPTP